jgi:hypothetical protein
MRASFNLCFRLTGDKDSVAEVIDWAHSSMPLPLALPLITREDFDTLKDDDKSTIMKSLYDLWTSQWFPLIETLKGEGARIACSVFCAGSECPAKLYEPEKGTIKAIRRMSNFVDIPGIDFNANAPAHYHVTRILFCSKACKDMFTNGVVTPIVSDFAARRKTAGQLSQ